MFRIEFYDGKIKMMTLLEKILLSEKFKTIPKLVVTTMQVTTTKNVNEQEFYSKFDSVFPLIPNKN